jgi:hypothetical protein
MILRAELFLKYLEKAETTVVVPSVVIGEFLVKVPAEKHQEVQAVLERRFQIIIGDLQESLTTETDLEKRRGIMTAMMRLRNRMKPSAQ